MGLVCLDSQIVIWGIKQQATSGQESMVVRAKNFIEWLHKERETVSIPALVLAEVMVKIEEKFRAEFVRGLEKYFPVFPFDNRAGMIYSRIHGDFAGKFKGNKTDRRSLKIDLMILAVALARGASILYTHDKTLLDLSVDGIEISPIPDVPIQPILRGLEPPAK